MTINYSRTDYNGEHFSHERNDCVVRAFMTATGCTYAEAHSTIRRECGRQDRKGTNSLRHRAFIDRHPRFTRVLKTQPERRWNGYRWQLKRPGAVSLARFIRENPVGTFYVCKPSHAFVIVDGVVIDTWEPGARCKITDAWRVDAPKAAPAVAPAPRPAPVVTPAPRPTPALAPRTAPAPRATVTPSGKARLPTALSSIFEDEGRALLTLNPDSIDSAIVRVVGAEVRWAMSDRQVAWATRFIKRGFKAA